LRHEGEHRLRPHPVDDSWSLALIVKDGSDVLDERCRRCWIVE